MIPDEILDLGSRNAIFIVNHSGGKDSQAMLAYLRRVVPARQLLVVHADLPGADWAGCWEHVRKDAEGLETMLVHSRSACPRSRPPTRRTPPSNPAPQGVPAGASQPLARAPRFNAATNASTEEGQSKRTGKPSVQHETSSSPN